MYVEGKKVYIPGLNFEYATASVDNVLFSPGERVPVERVDNDGRGKFIVGDY